MTGVQPRPRGLQYSQVRPVAAVVGAGNAMFVFNSLGNLMAIKLKATTGVFSSAMQVGTGGRP
jgi:hypothetical protein